MGKAKKTKHISNNNSNSNHAKHSGLIHGKDPDHIHNVVMKFAFFGAILMFALLLSQLDYKSFQILNSNSNSNRVGFAYNGQNSANLLGDTPATIRQYLIAASSDPSNYIIVIGRKASSSEVAKAAELAGTLGISRTMFDDEVSTSTLSNAIIFGTMNSNTLLKNTFVNDSTSHDLSKSNLSSNNNLKVMAYDNITYITNFLKQFRTSTNQALDTPCLSGYVTDFTACKAFVCGDFVVDPGEGCDTGNTRKCSTFESVVVWPNPNGDVQCSRCQWNLSICSISQSQCGNGIVESGEECDGLLNCLNCKRTNCTDSDGGINIAVKGTAYYKYETSGQLILNITDSCWGGTTGVSEASCNNNGVIMVTSPECNASQGKICLDGACVTANSSCMDECSSGQLRCGNVYEYQTCGNYDTDACLEWSTNISCGTGNICSGPGICSVNSTNTSHTYCVDTDAINPNISGHAYNWSPQYGIMQDLYDYCSNWETVYEASCDGTNVISHWYQCYNGCNNGACVNGSRPTCLNGVVEGNEQCDDGNSIDNDMCRNNCTYSQAYCAETDGGFNVNVSGYAYSWSPQYGIVQNLSDYCYNSHTVFESYCSDINVNSQFYTCPYGCSAGICLPNLTCNNECSTGQKRCSSNYGYQDCGDYDDDICLEWSANISCGVNNICTGPGICSMNSTNTSTPVCGNDIIEPPEQCEINDISSCDSVVQNSSKPWGIVTCTSTCQYNTSDCNISICGNGIREGTEKCDDGNLNNSDRCLNNCTFPTCFDSDGLNPFFKGSIYISGGSSQVHYDDMCYNASSVYEWICVNSSAQQQIISCQNGCVDGACVNNSQNIWETVTCKFNTTTAQNCTTLNGKYKCYNWNDCSSFGCQHYASCAISVNEVYGTKLQWSSSCTGVFNTTVDGINENVTFNCQTTPVCGNGIKEADEICDDGNNIDNDSCSATCLCMDTDPQQSNYVKGSISFFENNQILSFNDHCSTNPNYVYEMKCDSDSSGTILSYCQNGCSNGVCVNITTPVCGNGIIESGEACDGSVNGFNCSEFGNFTSGNLKCTNCQYDVSSCYSTRPVRNVISDIKTISTVKSKYAMLIGHLASASDSVAGVDIAGTTGIDTTIIDEAASATTSRPNRIIIGGPCVNSEAARLLGIPMSMPACYQNFPVQNGQAIIATVMDGNNEVIIVAGYSAEDTRRAGRIVVENPNGLSRSYMIV